LWIKGHNKYPKVAISKKFDGTKTKFCGFVMQVQLFLHMQPSYYFDEKTKDELVGIILSKKSSMLVCSNME